MATYNKATRSMTISLKNATIVTASDTDNDAIVTNALAEFDAKKIMHIKQENGIVLIPFHAVVKIVVTTTIGEVTKSDPYYCIDGEGATKVGTAKACSGKVGK